GIVSRFRDCSMALFARQFPRSLALLSPVVVGQVTERCLEEIAESSLSWIGRTEVTAQKTQREVLSELFGGGRIVNRSQKVAIERAVVAKKKLFLGRHSRVQGALVRLEDLRPLAFNT